MKKIKKKLLSRVLSVTLASALVSGAAVMTPVADSIIAGTSITANAAYEDYTTWTGQGIDKNGNSTTVTCYWKVKDGTLYIAGIIPNTNNSVPWLSSWNSITGVYAEEGTRTSADATQLFYSLANATSMDLTNLDTSAATTMWNMFSNCINLQTIYAGSGWNTDSINNNYPIFTGCSSIKGGAGTTYDANKTDKTYARIDGGTANPGYLTKKESAPTTTYTVTWLNEDGTTLSTSTVEEGTAPVYDGETPEKAGDDDYVYAFKGWTSDGGTIVYTAENLPNVTGDVTYTAVFDEFIIIHKDDVLINNTNGTPEITVTDCRTGAVLPAGTDYTLEIGDSTVKITGTGSYTGEVTKPFVILDKAATSDISARKKVGKNTKVTLTGTWNIPKDAQNIKGGIARLSTNDTGITKYDVYNNGVYKTSAITSPNAKYSYSLTMNSANAAKNLFAVTYVTYKIDGKQFVSISDVSQSLISFLS